MPLYIYRCTQCSQEDEELRSFEKMKETFPCSRCEGTMEHRFAATQYVRVKDRKFYKDPKTGQLTLKRRTRVLGTDIGRVDPIKLGNLIHEYEQKYGPKPGEKPPDTPVDP